LTTEQLQAARAEKWRQRANPLLTIEDAETWIESAGVSLFLPRKAQLQAPAPSFVEAVLGETNPTPSPEAIQNAFALATRLFAGEKATPLNLLGAASEQPDFLVSPEALPYVYALRGDRDWKRGPRDKSSPLVVDSWKLLKREGVLTAPGLQDLLGREVTEAAVLRALSELWTALRVLPVYSAGEATAWELFESRHQKSMQIGGGMAQATALSALISLYLDSVIAATSDEIEIFLSPLSPRSRIREVVRGLAATRQLLTIPLGAQSLLHIAGGLPEFPAIEAPAETQAAVAPEAAHPPRERRPVVPRGTPERGPRRERPLFRERPAAREGGKSASPERKRSGSERPRREWKPRPEQRSFGPGEARPPRPAGGDEGFRKPFRPRSGEQSSGAPERKSWKPRPKQRALGQGEYRPRREGTGQGGFKKPYRSQAGSQEAGEKFPRREGERPREFRPRRSEGGEGFGKPYRAAGDKRPAGTFSSRERGPQRPPRKEWKPRREGGPGEGFGERRSQGRGEFRPRRTGEQSERREFKPRAASGGGFRPRREGGGFAGKPKPAGEKRFGAKRTFENREGREGFDRKKPAQRERRETGSPRPEKSFANPGGKTGKSFGPPKGGRKRPAFGAKRPSRPGGKPSFGKRPNNRKGKKSSE